MRVVLSIICLLFGFGNCLHTRDGKITKPHVETYWESWGEGYGNYASELVDVPAAPVGSLHGVNVVNIAFALPNVTDDYPCKQEVPPCMTAGIYVDQNHLIQGIREIHEAGGFVKLSVGGMYNDFLGHEYIDIVHLVNRIEYVVREYNLDGVDINQALVCIPIWCSELVEVHEEVIKKLREELPTSIISYTIRDGSSAFYEMQVLQESHPYLDYVVALAGTPEVMENFHAFGVPKHKIVYGITTTEECSLGKAFEAAEFVRSGGYGGVLTWSINSDTDHRGDGRPGECTGFQTGYPDGTFVNTISQQLNF